MNARSDYETEIPTLRERIRQATATAILEAAEAVFAEQGVEGGRMNDIAVRAGVAVGTLYNHFADRQALFTGLVVKRKLEVIDMLDLVLDEPGLAFAARLARIFEQFFQYMEHHRGFHQFYLQVEAALSKLKVSTDLMREIYLRMEKIVKRGLKEKALRPSGAHLYPALLMGTIRALFLREQILGEPLTQPDVKEALRCFLEGAGA